jgi:hypothetical protein
VKLQKTISDVTDKFEASRAAKTDSDMKPEQPIVDFAAVQCKLSEDYRATQ